MKAGIQRALERGDAAVVALRDRLTPGQRWTSALALALVLVVLVWGLPTEVTIVPSSDRAGASGGSVRTDGTSDPAAAARQSQLVPAAPAVPALGPVGGSDPLLDPVAVLPVRPTVVALVRSGGLPGRDDETMARAFLDGAGFEATVVPIEGATNEVCAATLAAGRVVIASLGFDSELRRCLVDAGALIVAFDGAGDGPPSSPDGGQLLSTRRGVGASLVDLARWGVSEGALRGRVGLVGGNAVQQELEATVVRLRELGVNIVASTFVADDDPDVVATEVRRFSEAGVEVVLFAAPMGVQRRWVAQATVLGGGVQYVVSDAFDGVVDETYPLSFDGALAHTSLRLPWFARAKGETETQVACTQTWEEAAGGMLPGEIVPVFAWCQHVGMVGAALQSIDRGTPFGEALRRQEVRSPLTSDLGPLPAGGYGPTADAVLVWSGDCRCWEPRRDFTRR